jgi:hypothetical protein
MRRSVILVAAAIFLTWLYIYVLSFALELAGREAVPAGWTHPFQTSRSAVLPWMILRHTIAVTAASVPFAFVIARVYPRYWLLVALLATAPLYLATTMPVVVQNFGSSPLRLEIADILDAVTLVGILPLLTWGLRNLPSNMRWSGRAVNKVPGLAP